MIRCSFVFGHAVIRQIRPIESGRSHELEPQSTGFFVERGYYYANRQILREGIASGTVTCIALSKCQEELENENGGGCEEVTHEDNNPRLVQRALNQSRAMLP